MGHSQVNKARTHVRLVEAAAARFKERGIDGISLADLMKDLDLTHGGFYKHFASRDELVTEALQLALAQSGEVMRQRLFDGGKADVAGFVDFYLGEAHRDGPVEGCAVAALSGDATRKSADVQAQFRKHIEGNLETLAQALPPGHSAADSRATAILVLSALYGALIMARAVGDSPLSKEVLRTARSRILELSGAAKRRGARAAAKVRPTSAAAAVAVAAKKN